MFEYEKVFEKEAGWPFPFYYGACGRLMAESYEGYTLNHFIDKPFRLRVNMNDHL